MQLLSANNVLLSVQAGAYLNHVEDIQLNILLDLKTLAGDFAVLELNGKALNDVNLWYKEININPRFSACDKSQAFGLAMLVSNIDSIQKIIKQQPQRAESYKEYLEPVRDSVYYVAYSLLTSCNRGESEDMDVFTMQQDRRQRSKHINGLQDALRQTFVG